MANFRNEDWRGLLDRANKEIGQKGYKIEVEDEDDRFIATDNRVTVTMLVNERSIKEAFENI